MDHFGVVPYSIAELSRLLTAQAGAMDPEAAKSHLGYFGEYFSESSGVGAKTIVVENDYIDRDFLEDYAAFYVRCFYPYGRHCVRLHFFQDSFGKADFVRLIVGEPSPLSCDGLKRGYLGFIVVKPLPKTVVGRTCLRHYRTDVATKTGRRVYPNVRTYQAHLFGLTFSIETLAFQEQDKVVAACATSALWSVFQGTGKLYHHPIPSPVEITRAATIPSALETRALPNKGLTVYQLAQAIRSVGLEPQSLSARDEYLLKAATYAYLQGKSPLLLGLHMVDLSRRPKDYDAMPAASRPPDYCRGAHVVAVTGFSLAKAPPKPASATGFLLRAARLDKLYVHDDQIGPFSRIAFGAGTLRYRAPDRPQEITSGSFKTSWPGGDGAIGSMRACPTYLLIPLYHKVRIPFGTIHEVVVRCDSTLEAMRLSHKFPVLARLEWDIRLVTLCDLKAELLAVQLAPDYKASLLTQPMPRFIWRATALANDQPVLDLLFDATDIEQGSFFVRAVEYNEHVKAVLRGTAHDDVWKEYFDPMTYRVVEWFRSQPL